MFEQYSVGQFLICLVATSETGLWAVVVGADAFTKILKFSVNYQIFISNAPLTQIIIRTLL
jgi:hypothetical protein